MLLLCTFLLHGEVSIHCVEAAWSEECCSYVSPRLSEGSFGLFIRCCLINESFSLMMFTSITPFMFVDPHFKGSKIFEQIFQKGRKLNFFYHMPYL